MENAVPREIVLELTREHCALIIEGLAGRPFREVFALIGMLHAAPARVTLSPAQLRLILDTLGAMPFKRVCNLLHNMQQQMLAQQD